MCIVGIGAVVLSIVLSLSSAVQALPPRCPDGSFAVDGAPLFANAEAGPDGVLVAGSWVKVMSGCNLGKGRVRAARKGTVVRMRWRRCYSTRGAVQLSATIDAATCSTMTGSLRFERIGRRQKFRAVRKAGGAAGGTFALIQERIFARRGCTVESCHGATLAGGLDLRADAAYDALVGAAASNASARAAGRLRVVPGEAWRSFLLDKLFRPLTPEQGASMPLVGAQLTPAESGLLTAWIKAGAPATGDIKGAPELPHTGYVPAPPLPVPDPADGYQLVLEGPVLQPGEEQEGCLWIPAPNAEDMLTRGFEVSLNPGTHHFAIWRYDRQGVPPLGVWTKDDIACLSGASLGSGVGGSPQTPHFRADNPPGIAGRLPGGGYYGLNAHYYNEFDVPIQVKVWTNYYRYQGTPEHMTKNLTVLDKTGDIFVPIYREVVHKGRWVNDTGRAVNLLNISGHMHKRGKRFSAWLGDGTKLFDDLDWAHPQGRSWWPSFVMPPGGVIDYECLHDNGVERPVRLDPAGNPTAVRFGISAEDEMCILNISYYDD
jgi:hypothetical protein